jgi:hypothetical protein
MHVRIYYLRHGSVEELDFTPNDWNCAKNAAYRPTSWILAPLECETVPSYEASRAITHCELEEVEVKAVVALTGKSWRDCAKPRVT